MQRSKMNIGDPVEYPQFTHGRKGLLLKGTIREIPTDPTARVTIQTAKGYPVCRLDVHIHPVVEVIHDDKCPCCGEKLTECLYERRVLLNARMNNK